MSGHTPGPWMVIPGGDEWNQGRVGTIEPQPETMIEPNYWTVAECNSRRDEYLANANLIAAAPDLLEALENLFELYGDEPETDYAKSTHSKVKAVIARAKGQS